MRHNWGACKERKSGMRAHHELQGGQLGIQQLGEVLVVVPDLQVVVSLDHAVQRLERAQHELEQRALARAVGAHDRDPAVQVHAQVHLRSMFFPWLHDHSGKAAAVQNCTVLVQG